MTWDDEAYLDEWDRDEDESTETPPPREYSERFVEIARRFVRRWNVGYIGPKVDGVCRVEPASIWCATHEEEQGTYVFIPRYYKWNDLKNYKRDFELLEKKLDATYKKFSPARITKADRSLACIEYVKQELVKREAQKESLKQTLSKPQRYKGPIEEADERKKAIFAFVDKWLQTEGLLHHSTRTFYRNAVRKAFF